MELLHEYFELILKWLYQPRNQALLAALAAGVAVIEKIFAPFRGLWRILFGRKADPAEAKFIIRDTAHAGMAEARGGAAIGQMSGGALHQGVPYEKHFAALEARETALRADLERAHAAEKAVILNELDAVRAKRADPKGTIAALETEIASLRRQLGNDSSAAADAARAALDAGDLDTAREAFETIRAEQEGNIRSAAAASFALGEIAESEIRWRDALAHFTDAARLHENFANLRKLWDMHRRLGDHLAAASDARRLEQAALAEFGANSAEHGEALNARALIANAQGDFTAAEPLYRQAKDITAATLGEAHPDNATSLNNLAGLLHATGRHGEAEPLYRQAKDITAATLGAAHPTYATRLNNLAGLLRDTGRVSEAVPLFEQAVAIATKALGPEHLTTRTFSDNLAAARRDQP